MAVGHFWALCWLTRPSRAWQMPLMQWMRPSQGRGGGSFAAEPGCVRRTLSRVSCLSGLWPLVVAVHPLSTRGSPSHTQKLSSYSFWPGGKSVASAGFGFLVDTIFSLSLVYLSLDERKLDNSVIFFLFCVQEAFLRGPLVFADGLLLLFAQFCYSEESLFMILNVWAGNNFSSGSHILIKEVIISIFDKRLLFIYVCFLSI